MKVLLVEDNDEDANRLVGAVSASANIEFERVSSRNSAERLLGQGRHFDLVICDLRIPAQDDGINRAAQHGLAVQAAIARELPGTPTRFLTGVAEANIDDLSDAISDGDVTQVLADGQPLRMVRLYRKDRLLACAQEILDLADRLRRLDDIYVEGIPALLNGLAELERRAICLAARQWNGTRVAIRSLGGGLSGGRTLHALISDDRHERASVFLKIDRGQRCDEERARYNEFVAGRLSHYAFPHLEHDLSHCLGNMGCLVYKFADDWDASLFEHVSHGIDEPQVVADVRTLMTQWESMTEERRVTFRQLRESQISYDALQEVVYQHDSQAEELLAALDENDRISVSLTVFPQHGDLHGENVLLASSSRPTLIDCGDVGLHPAGLDPVTLELSVILHPESPLASSGWPNPTVASRWLDVDSFVQGCPYREFVVACRQWALEVAGSEGMRVAAFQHVTRQLKYADTRKDVLIAILRGLISA